MSTNDEILHANSAVEVKPPLAMNEGVSTSTEKPSRPPSAEGEITETIIDDDSDERDLRKRQVRETGFLRSSLPIVLTAARIFMARRCSGSSLITTAWAAIDTVDVR